MPASQRLRWLVAIRRFHTSWARITACCNRSSPLPVFAETVTKGAPLNCGNSRSKDSRNMRSFACFSGSRSHLLTAKTTARPSRSARSEIRRSCCSKGISASSKTTTTSANFTARSPSLTDSFSNLACTLAFLRIPAVSKIRVGTPPQSKVKEMASRVIPASGPVNRRSSPIILLISVDFPAFGRPMTATCRGFCKVGRRYSSCSSPSGKSISTSGASSLAFSSAASISGASIIASSPIPSPCSADRRKGSPSPKE